MDLYYSRKSVGLCIFLCIITCGIYGYVWLYQLLSTMYRQNNQPNNAGIDIVLYIVTCGIYGFYLNYKLGKMESEMHHRLGMPPKDDSVLYLVLGIFILWIVVYAIIQSNINNLVDQLYGRGPHGPHGPGPHGPHGGPGYGPGPGGHDPGRMQ